ncbi:MAG: 2-C-methyl-D-erythritol 4-phosphate cytidylyltransferase [Nanoarchaeota archaeon]|nr:2-C-methyl-D-erythritol 4-phosphate cytidylyltransferase [Nanoarchaeota archaeon]
MTTHAIITCAGVGKRMQSEVNKIFLLLDKESIVERTIRVFQACDAVDEILLVAREQDKAEIERLAASKGFSKVKKVVLGGERRQQSVYNALISLEAKADDIVLVHNGVNPFVDDKTIREVIDAAKKYEAAVVGFKARDTLKEVDEKGFVVGTLDRSVIWQVQTPQAFRFGAALKAYKEADKDNFKGTDDAMLIERLGKRVKMVECAPENIKLTLPTDLEFANKLLSTSRIGFGMDSHRFLTEGEKKLVIGGIETEGKGFDANSDGDVVLHALFNAISNGLGEKSLGHFADPMCEKGVKDSAEYLKVILGIMKERGYALGNVGVMLEGKSPKIVPIEDKMKEHLSQLLSLPASQIGITATSGESLTAFGKGLGMQCFCVVSLHKN